MKLFQEIMSIINSVPVLWIPVGILFIGLAAAALKRLPSGRYTAGESMVRHLGKQSW